MFLFQQDTANMLPKKIVCKHWCKNTVWRAMVDTGMVVPVKGLQETLMTFVASHIRYHNQKWKDSLYMTEDESVT
jgi:hypothetical protein